MFTKTSTFPAAMGYTIILQILQLKVTILDSQLRDKCKWTKLQVTQTVPTQDSRKPVSILKTGGRTPYLT